MTKNSMSKEITIALFVFISIIFVSTVLGRLIGGDWLGELAGFLTVAKDSYNKVQKFDYRA